MKAVVLTAYGDPATGLELRELPEPASQMTGLQSTRPTQP